MGKPVPIQTKMAEAVALEKLIDARHHGTRAEFARKAGITGGRSMLHQHLKALKPISPEAAIQYARALGCHVSEFSPRVADMIDAGRAPYLTHYPDRPDIPRLMREPGPRDALLKAINDLAHQLSDTGLHILKDKAGELARDYALTQSPPAKSSGLID